MTDDESGQVRCEIVRVSVLDEDGTGAIVEVPAYTLSPQAFRARGKALVEEYLVAAALVGDEPSLGDFAMYALAKASLDPREQRK